MSFGENTITYLSKKKGTGNTSLSVKGESVDTSNVNVTVDDDGNVFINSIEVGDHDISQIRVATEPPSDLKDGEIFGIIVKGEE